MSDIKHIQIGLLSADKDERTFITNSFGKKGQSSDITMFTLFSDNILQSTIVPERYPERPISLITTAHMSDVLMVTCTSKGVDQYVGESALIADTLNIPGIKAVIGADATGLTLFIDQMNKLFAKLNVAEYEGMILSNNKEISEARNTLLKLAPGHRGQSDGFLAINVDHAFPVKGVGSVILGTVISGTVKKGQKIKVFPEGQEGIVRSIQVNDVEMREAGPGTHVGLAMKGILPKYLNRGTVVAAADQNDVTEINKLENIPIRKAAFGKGPLEGDVIHVVSGLFHATGKIISWGDKVTIEMERLIPFHPLMRITFLDLNKKPAILGSRIL